MTMKKIFLLLVLFKFCTLNAQINVQFSIDTKSDRHEISPLIYGNNFSPKSKLTTGENYAFTRIGGNRATAYNWENNASNAGSDWYHQSDDFWCGEVNNVNCDEPASVYSSIISDALSLKVVPLVTVPMCNFVAADKNGKVGEDNPPSRWCKLQTTKGSALSLVPDTSDRVVYSDEFINFLKTNFGAGNLKYALDNEPDLWSHTHTRIFSNKISCKDLLDRTIDYSKMIKSLDPDAEVFGFVSYGFNGFLSLQDAPDWKNYKPKYEWFIDYFLEQTKTASDKEGKRLVDVLDLHWYPESKGDLRVVDRKANSTADKLARLQAPRSLWDSLYVEKSWIAQSYPKFLPLLPNLQKSIDKFNPGTKLAFTEFQYGGYEDITGTIAIADVLGIFGKYGVYAANHWGTPGSFGVSAYKLFRNFDSKNGKFGDISVQAKTTDNVNSSLYASSSDEKDNELHLIALNKNMEQVINATFTFSKDSKYKSAEVYVISGVSPEIQQKETITINGNEFKYTLPALSVFHFVLKK